MVYINHTHHHNRMPTMPQTAKVFTNGRSQAVRLPAAFRFDVTEVFVRQDPETGDVILSRRPNDWTGFVQALRSAPAPEDFLSAAERAQPDTPRDPLDGLA
jgi:antitoxin VapB